jgi:Uma2 family endonuclease
MTEITPIPSEPTRISVDCFFRLYETGELDDADRVELLEGVIVSMTPIDPPHASATMLATVALQRSVQARATVRCQTPLLVGIRSVPVPDVTVVPGCEGDYGSVHPSSAHLVVEVADSTLGADRLTKSRIYAAAGVPEYWIVNLRDFVVEVMRDPDPANAVYRGVRVARDGDTLELAALPGARVAVAELLPKRS